MASVISLIAAACGGATPSTAAVGAASPAASPSVVAVTPEPVATGEGGLTADGKVLIRWFVGLGTGAQPDQIADEQAVVTAFNESQDKITLKPRDRPEHRRPTTSSARRSPPATRPTSSGRSASAASTRTATSCSTCSPFIEKTNYDLSDIDPGASSRPTSEGFGGQVGIPFAIYPSFIYYNKDLFKEAGVAGAAAQGRRAVRRQGLDLGHPDASSPRS